MEYTKGAEIKQRFADKLVNCDTSFEGDQLVAVLDICDELGIPDMYEALKKLTDLSRPLSREDMAEGNKALIKAEGKGE